MEKRTNNFFNYRNPLFGILFLFFINTVVSAQTLNLTLTVEGIDQSKGGSINLGVFNSAESFKTKTDPLFKASLMPVDSLEEFTFKQIPAGFYAIALYHDENGDKVLNTKKFGIPTEGVGFSGNRKSKIKPPDFEEAGFTYSKDTTVFIELRYPAKSQHSH